MVEKTTDPLTYALDFLINKMPERTARRRRKTKPTTDAGSGDSTHYKESTVLDINPRNLQHEWEHQAAVFYQFSSQLADARAAEDDAKRELDVTKAELDADIRSDPDSYGIERVSEGAIKNVMIQQKSYDVAVKTHNSAIHAVRMLEAMVKALEHRRTALKALVDLKLASYYSEGGMPSGSPVPKHER